MPNNKGPWCPTRGYLSEGGGAPAPAARADAPPPAAEETAPGTPAKAPARAAPAGGGKRVWAPTRGYMEGGAGGASPAPAKKAAARGPEKTAGTGDATKAPGEAPPPGAKREPVAATAVAKKPAAKKAPASGEEAPKRAPAPKADPRRESMATVEPLASHRVFSDAARALYTEPDSENTLYRVPVLNVLFAISSAALVVSLVMVFWQDYDRQWKHVQGDWRDTLIASYSNDREEASARQFPLLVDVAGGLEGILRKLAGGEADAVLAGLTPVPAPASADEGGASFKRFNRLVERIAGLRQAVRSRLESDETYQELSARSINASTLAGRKDWETKAFRGDFQAAKFEFEEEKKHILRRGHTQSAVARVEELEEEFNRKWVLELESLQRELSALEREAKAAQAAIDEHVRGVTLLDGPEERHLALLEGRFESLVHPVNTVSKQLDLIDRNWRNAVRNAPLLDFLAPVYKIDKVVTPGLEESLNFLNVPRIHRCKTCHINIDSGSPEVIDFESPDWGSVYQSHPRLDLFLSAASPHGYEQFGCTTCHYGDGHALDFTVAAHTPRDREQEEHWAEKYHWHELHHQDFPMLPSQYVTSSCTKCHGSERHLEGAEKLNRGAELVRTYGCFGCHKIEGFEIAAPGEDDRVWKLEKVGPNLRHLADKVSFDFLTRWIRQPQHFRRSTRMPRFFDLTNTDGEMVATNAANEPEVVDFGIRNGVEVLALATYLYKTSEVRRDLPQLPIAGDPARGRELVKTTGCLGCHSVKVESERYSSEPLPSLATVREEIRSAALAQRTGSAAPGFRLAARYDEVGKRLEKLFDWLDRLSVGEDVETLYHEFRASVEEARPLEELAGATESPLESASTLAASVHQRWVHNTFAPDLSTLARKFDLETTAGRERAEMWLADWILDPSRHDPHTVMPRFRLEQDADGEQKVADMVSYLLTLDYNHVDFAAEPSATPETLAAPETKAERDAAWRDGVAALSVQEVEGKGEVRAVLDDLAFSHLRVNHSVPEARELVREMAVEEKLAYVGHRLVRHYGCFGCHNGIRDLDPDPTLEPAQDAVATFDTSQQIGTELNKWGNKDADRLDYGQWGHQPDGSQAIPHTRYDWARAKLSDTRRFDVFPRAQRASGGRLVYTPSDRLIQKSPAELLKMPLFPFHDDEEQVEAVVNFVISLADDPIAPEKKKTLDEREKVLEAGSRLVEKLNCAGCHRLGAKARYVHVDDLPNPNGLGDEDARTAVMEPETWLARPTQLVVRPVASPTDRSLGIRLPAGFPLTNQIGQYETGDPEADAKVPAVFTENEDPMSVVEAARRHFDPLPGFIQDVARSIDGVVNGDTLETTLANRDIFAFVSDALESGEGNAERMLRRLRAEYEKSGSPVGEFLASMIDRPYLESLEAWRERPNIPVSELAELSNEYFAAKGGEVRVRPEDERLLAVEGFREGSVRFYFGTSVTDRFKAPPPLLRQGERVHGDWLFHFLLDVEPIRPWLKIRMPSFRLRQDEARLIVKWFKEKSGVPYGDEVFAADRIDRDLAETGRLLFGAGNADVAGKQCNSCHPRGSELPSLPLLEPGRGSISPEEVPLSAPGESHYLVWRDARGAVQLAAGFPTLEEARAEGERRFGGSETVWAAGKPWDKSSWGPDLSLAAERLRPDWVRDWLYYPPDFMPGTKMPNFFDEKGERSKYHGRSDAHIDVAKRAQVEALVQYLRHMNAVDVASRPKAGGGSAGGGGD